MRWAEEKGWGGGTQEPFHFVTLRVQSGWGGRGEVGEGGCIEQVENVCVLREFAWGDPSTAVKGELK